VRGKKSRLETFVVEFLLYNSKDMNIVVYEENVQSDSDGSPLRDEEYEDEDQVWSGPNGEDVCYDMTCHEHVQELQQIVNRWRGHNESIPLKKIANDMKTIHNATSELLSIQCIPEVTYGEWEACDRCLEEGSVTKPLQVLILNVLIGCSYEGEG
jgi:hypothetical protein